MRLVLTISGIKPSMIELKFKVQKLKMVSPLPFISSMMSEKLL